MKRILFILNLFIEVTCAIHLNKSQQKIRLSWICILQLWFWYNTWAKLSNPASYWNNRKMKYTKNYNQISIYFFTMQRKNWKSSYVTRLNKEKLLIQRGTISSPHEVKWAINDTWILSIWFFMAGSNVCEVASSKADTDLTKRE